MARANTVAYFTHVIFICAFFMWNFLLLDRDKSPLEFYASHKNTYPGLNQLQQKYLCIPGTSVPAERFFFSKHKTDILNPVIIIISKILEEAANMEKSMIDS